MRLISQDGFYDVPYESVWLRVDEEDGRTIYAVPLSAVMDDMSCDFPLPVMGAYSTEEKAKRAMELLHNAYVGIIKGLNVEIPEGAEGRLKEIMKNGYGMLIAKESWEGNRIEFYPMNTIFQFPSDEELEE